MVEITTNKIDIQQIIQSVVDPGAGGIDVFIGTTRDNAHGKRVLWLEYEAYEPMATATMKQIVVEAQTKWKLNKISVIHRIGRVDIGEASVVIAVSSAHRDEAFKACRFLIDQLKQTAPIWKKEYFEDGESWVNPVEPNVSKSL